VISPGLTDELAAGLARIARGHVSREYPNKLDHVLGGPEDLRGPRDLHPAFFGSLDWHSCVHGFWLLARIRRLHPGLAEAAAIDRLFAVRITQETIAGERAYLDRPLAGGFERPYGWAWLLMLAAEVSGTPDGETLRPLADVLAARFLAWLPKATYPIRAGTHSNSAFALVLALAYAEVAADAVLAAAARTKARAWYSADADCQAWEPSGEDFLSPALIEAACMRAVLPADEFGVWFARFLPRLAAGEPAALFHPVSPSDRSDGRIAHLDGLNLSRAWCWRLLARTLPPDDPRLPPMCAAAEAHLAAGLPHVRGDYMGEHWLASFAALALGAG
jgi:hypothetical protein